MNAPKFVCPTCGDETLLIPTPEMIEFVSEGGQATEGLGPVRISRIVEVRFHDISFEHTCEVYL